MTHEPPTTHSKGDVAHTAVKGVLGAIPFAGTAAAEFFQLAVTAPLEKRRNAWLAELAEALHRLEERKLLTADELSENQAFLDAVVQASQAAAKYSSRTKREALRNAVLNAALSFDVDRAREELFINWVDSLTEWHLRILKLFTDPLKWYQDQGRTPPQYVLSSSLNGLLVDAFPELKDDRPLYEKLWKDIYSAGLIDTDSLFTMMSAGGAFEKRGTKLGQELLDFISEPINK